MDKKNIQSETHTPSFEFFLIISELCNFVLIKFLAKNHYMFLVQRKKRLLILKNGVKERNALICDNIFLSL